MNRLIDADAIISFVDAGHLRNPLELAWSDNDVVDMIESRPTVDAVPVVRCKECKYMRESVDGLFKSGYFCERCHITSDMENCDDFYCADGERRSDEQQPQGQGV